MTSLATQAAVLTREALEEDWVGLHEENAELRAEVAALKAERDRLRKQPVNGAQGEIERLREARDRAMNKAAQETRRANAMQRQRDEARKELAAQEVEI